MRKLDGHKLAAVALGILVLQSSCWNDAYDDDVMQISLAVSQDSFSSSTKGSVNNIADFKAQGSFGVFGTKSLPNSTAAPVYRNQNVSWNGTKWTYSPLKYWDRDAAYCFGAYAPHISATSGDDVYVDYSMENKTFSLNNIPNLVRASMSSEESFDGVDYMVAASSGEARTYLSSTYLGVVDFSFSHILSMFEVTVSYPSKNSSTGVDDDPGVDYFLMDVEIGSNTPEGGTAVKVPAPDGKFKYTCDYSSGVVGSYSDVTMTTDKISIYHVNSWNEGLNIPVSPAKSLGYWLCVPFTDANGIYLRAQFKAGAGDSQPSWSNYLRLGTLTGFEAGKKYTIDLRFDHGKLIELSDVIISDWPATAVEDSHPVYNW